MTLFDYVVLLVMACSVLIGLFRGLIKELISLVGWIAALVVANAYAGVLADLLPAAVPGQALRLIVAFIALFIGVRLLIMLLAMLLDSLIEATGLTMADRGLGAVFGLARGVVLVLAGVLVCGMTQIPHQEFWKNAMLSPMAVSAVSEILPLLPDKVSQQVKF
ncbi:MAG: CvpA family protein [Burkholderiaceae bacterium]|nr:CvpA family protein [Burkholderiaceae bacterium]